MENSQQQHQQNQPLKPIQQPAQFNQVTGTQGAQSTHPQQKKHSGIKTCLFSCLGLVLLLGGLGIGGYFYGNGLMTKAVGTDDKSREFTIEEGEGVRAISNRLAQEKLISNTYVFQWLVLKEGISSYFQPGTYTLRQSMRMDEIAHVLARQKELIPEKDVTFVEGWTRKQILEKISSDTDIDAAEFGNRINNPHQFYDDYDFVKELAPSATLEGYLFPDTYRIDETTTADQLIRKMLSNFGKKLSYELRATAKASGWTVNEVTTLASIVEREVQTPKDKKLVSGVFQNRLSVGKRLESDVTINYGLEIDPSLDSSSYTKTDSPYNTYIIPGLPPAPIANPGLDTINAVIEPTVTDYYYFLSVPDTGEVIYAKTFDEHQKNVQKYLR